MTMNVPSAATSGHLDSIAHRRRRRPPRHRRPRAGATSVLGEELGEDDPAGGLDEREVRERLREVAEVEPGADVELLGVQPERRGDAQQPLEEVASRAGARRRSDSADTNQ